MSEDHHQNQSSPCDPTTENTLNQDENYRNMILPKLNRSLDRAASPDDHIQDVVRDVHFLSLN